MRDELKAFEPYFGLTNIYDGIKSTTKFNPDELNRNHKTIPKNHKKFIIEGIEIYALSEKRAIEKFKIKQNGKSR